jgi:hypothetical protein
MIRNILAILAGLFTWGVVATVLDVVLRRVIPGYAAAEPQLHFTLGMMLARLALPGALSSVAAGFVSSLIGRGHRIAVAALAMVLLAVFLPTHYRLWTSFPAWFHLTFLGSLLVMPWLGAGVARRVAAGRLDQGLPRAAA